MRHKDANWNLPERITQWDQARVGLLMDIRDELKTLNRLLHCANFVDIPNKLAAIKRNTTKKRRVRRKP